MRAAFSLRALRLLRGLTVCAALSACGQAASDPATAIVVQIWSDLDSPAEMDAIDVGITTAGTELRRLPVDQQASGHQRRIFHHLSLLSSGDPSRSLRITATAKLVGRSVVTQSLETAFTPGSRRVLVLSLDRACIPVTCGAPMTTCEQGQCRSDRRLDLPVYEGP